MSNNDNFILRMMMMRIVIDQSRQDLKLYLKCAPFLTKFLFSSEQTFLQERSTRMMGMDEGALRDMTVMIKIMVIVGSLGFETCFCIKRGLKGIK